MREQQIEQRFRDRVRKAGGQALKFTAPGFTGVPDRIALMPGGRIAFAEMKTPCGRLSARQKIVINMLRSLGFPVYVIHNEETLLQFENEILK